MSSVGNNNVGQGGENSPRVAGDREKRQTIELRSWMEGEYWCAEAVNPYTLPQHLSPQEARVSRSRYSRQRALAYALIDYQRELHVYDPTTAVD